MGGKFRICKERQIPFARYCGGMMNMLIVFVSMSLTTGTAFAAAFGMVTDNESDEMRLFNAETGVIVASLKGSPGQINGDCALSEDESTGFSSNAGRNISVFRFTDSASGKNVDFSSIDISNAGVCFAHRQPITPADELALAVP